MRNYDDFRFNNGANSWRRKLAGIFGASSGKAANVTQIIIVVTIAFYLLTMVFKWVYLDLLFYPPLAFIEPWRFLTSALLHADFMHIFFNLYSLWLLGSVVEPIFGKFKFAGLYLFSAIIGSFFVYGYALLFGQMQIALVGASGAIFGLFGAMLILTRHVKGTPPGS
ncbi:rhomboid family intramembrane serine protease [Arcanobacterium hippocoleae]|uniref:rhomboid family intramembrane serine protease n=1 Tax=Arcanobacterium hippocoleae TaxID=149017 RepID=UPI0033414D6B